MAKKLGIKARTTVNLVGAPQGFERELGDVPEQVLIRRNARERSDITVWFTRSRDELEGDIKHMAAFSKKGGWMEDCDGRCQTERLSCCLGPFLQEASAAKTGGRGLL